MSVTPDCFEMTLLRSGNETNAKDCSSSSMATAILPVSDVGVVNADVSQTTGDLYLNLLLKSYQDQIATLKDELQERNKLILSLLHSDKNAVKVSNSVESPTSSLKSSTSRTLDKDKNIPWQLPKKAVRIDQTTVCSGTGIVILWNCDFGTGFRTRDLSRKLQLQILQAL